MYQKTTGSSSNAARVYKEIETIGVDGAVGPERAWQMTRSLEKEGRELGRITGVGRAIRFSQVVDGTWMRSGGREDEDRRSPCVEEN